MLRLSKNISNLRVEFELLRLPLQKCDILELRENQGIFEGKLFAKEYCVLITEINPQKLKKN